MARACVAPRKESAVEPGMTRAEALAALRGRLRRAGVASADHDAERLLLHATGIERAALWADPRLPLSPREAVLLAALGERRERRVPLQHLLGEVPFHEVTLAVGPGALVPRPETECLVEAVLETVAPTGALLDWGTGSGAIAIALLHALPGWTGVAADRSPAALALARRNAARNGVADRLRIVAADYSAAAVPTPAAPPPSAPPAARAPLPGASYDLVVSNPPYVRTSDIDGLMPEVRLHDPREALDGGPDGLDAYRHLARGLSAWLRPGGVFGVEIGADQADEVMGLLGSKLIGARILPDREGMPRILVGTMRGGGT
jgi:release factor glutamine methyltransferase